MLPGGIAERLTISCSDVAEGSGLLCPPTLEDSDSNAIFGRRGSISIESCPPLQREESSDRPTQFQFALDRIFLACVAVFNIYEATNGVLVLFLSAAAVFRAVDFRNA